jgi:hypothetical protein
MPRKKQQIPLLLNEPSTEDLEHICSVLNGEKQPELQLPLRRLVKSWQASGPNLKKMMHANFEEWRDVQESWKATWVPSYTGRAHLLLLPDLPSTHMEQGQDGAYRPTPEGGALVLFYSLTLNPEWDRLGGPCERCAKYYVMNTVRQKKYCSRRCGSFATATASTRKRLDEEHAHKLRRAQAAAQMWSKTLTSLDWKRWVSRKEPDMTPKWLTRAVNKAELSAPKNRRKLSLHLRRGN